MSSLFKKGFRKIHRGFNILNEKLAGLDFTKGLTLEELGLTKEEGNIYAASAIYDLKKIFQSLEIRSTDSILDLGCGKGLAMYEMSKHPFARIAGVEINLKMCKVARQNFKQLKLDKLEVFHSDAGAFEDIDDYNFFYLFNPFPKQVLASVLNNIQSSFQRNPRKLTLIYYLPAQQQLIENHGFFKLSYQLKGEKYNTSFFVRKLN